MQKYHREPEAISNNIFERIEVSKVYADFQPSEEDEENLEFKPHGMSEQLKSTLNEY